VVSPTTRPGTASPLLSRRFLGATLAFAFGFGTMMAYISASPFLYQNIMGLTPIQFGLVFSFNAVLLTLAGTLAARWADRFSSARVAQTGLVINLVAVLVMAAMELCHTPVGWVAVPIAIVVGTQGLFLGNTTALALRHVPRQAGTGSAIMGVIQFGLAGVIAPLVGDGALIPLVTVMFVCSVVANLALAVAARPGATHQ
jgi:DHA1 family bicyclomycin/chloramphenicol resistance-like MFS transporter